MPKKPRILGAFQPIGSRSAPLIDGIMSETLEKQLQLREKLVQDLLGAFETAQKLYGLGHGYGIAVMRNMVQTADMVPVSGKAAAATMRGVLLNSGKGKMATETRVPPVVRQRAGALPYGSAQAPVELETTQNEGEVNSRFSAPAYNSLQDSGKTSPPAAENETGADDDSQAQQLVESEGTGETAQEVSGAIISIGEAGYSVADLAGADAQVLANAHTAAELQEILQGLGVENAKSRTKVAAAKRIIKAAQENAGD